MADTKIDLIYKTGICAGNYKFWESKEECDQWFLSKSIGQFTNLSFVRPDSNTKNAYNAASVHLPLPYHACVECDYVSFNNEAENGRMFHAQIIGREYVNKNSTRLYFVVDYVATFWDTIKIGKSFVERTHVDDDWSGSFTASKYLLPEPIPQEVFYRPELNNSNPMDEIGNEELANVANGTIRFNMITTISLDGELGKPKINYQAGGSIAGYVNVGTKEAIEEAMEVYVTQSIQLLNRKDTILSYLNNVYVAPIVVSENESDSPETQQTTATFSEMFALDRMYKPKHAKVYDYLRVRFNNLGGSVMFMPHDVKDGLTITMFKTGSPTGCYTAVFENANGGEVLTRLASPNWPAVNVTASQKSHTTEVNRPVVSWWHENIPFTAEFDKWFTEKTGWKF